MLNGDTVANGKNGKVILGPLVLLAIGASIFAMHYGAACMLWPTTWGRNAGSSYIITFAGFFLTGIILPFLGYFAVQKGGGPLFVLSTKVGPRFAQFFGGLTVLVMGPLFVIPRMSAAAWDALSKIFGIETAPWIVVVLFTVVYYAIVYWFIYVETQIVDKLSVTLVPFLVLLEVAIIIKVLSHPIAAPASKLFTENPFAYGFINGYQTMDLPAALMFAGVILADIGARVKQHKGSIFSNLLRAGIIGFAILALIELGEFAVGAYTGHVYKDLDYAKLYATIVLNLWGKTGGAFFNIALVLAAMTTAIGLTAGTGAYFVDALKGKYSYRQLVVATLFVSTIISVCGLAQIVKWTAPILNLIYPPCIAIVLFTVFAPNLLGAMRGATLACTGWGVIEALRGYLGLFGVADAFQGLYNIVPGANLGFGWIIFFILGAIIGYVMMPKKESESVSV